MMKKCFCFSKKGSRKKLRTLEAQNGLPVRLPPEVTGRITAAVATSLNETIYTLARKGKTEELKALLEKGSREHLNRWLTWVDDSNRTALVIAAREGHASCMKILIEKGADVTHMSTNRDEGSALHIAARKKLSPRIIYSLLEKGANPFVENYYHLTAWDFARQHTNWTAISIFNDLGLYRRTLPIQVGSGNCITSMRDICVLPRTLYICSVGPYEDHSDVDLTGAQAEWIPEETEDIASILLTFPATRARLAKDLSTDMQTSSAVMYIWIPKWSAWSLRDLIEIINQEDEARLGKHPKATSSDEVDIRVMDWIRQQTASQCSDHIDSIPCDEGMPDEAYRLAESGDVRALESLLRSFSRGDRIRALCWEHTNGHTPLMIATENRHVEVVELLLRYGANVYHCNRRENGGTALHLAITANASSEITHILLSAHANPLVENADRVTAADLSGGDRNLMICEELLFQEVMRGAISLQGCTDVLQGDTDFLIFIAPRYACCDRPQDLRRISKTMHIYQATSDEPLMEIDLYEARAKLFTQTTHEYRDVLLTLSSDAILTWNWAGTSQPEAGQPVRLLMSFPSAIEKCGRLVKIINIEDGLRIDPYVKQIWRDSRQLKQDPPSTVPSKPSSHKERSASTLSVISEPTFSENDVELESSVDK